GFPPPRVQVRQVRFVVACTLALYCLDIWLGAFLRVVLPRNWSPPLTGQLLDDALKHAMLVGRPIHWIVRLAVKLSLKTPRQAPRHPRQREVPFRSEGIGFAPEHGFELPREAPLELLGCRHHIRHGLLVDECPGWGIPPLPHPLPSRFDPLGHIVCRSAHLAEGPRYERDLFFCQCQPPRFTLYPLLVLFRQW